MDCACDNDLSALVISGHPLPELLSIAWAEILEDWEDTIGGDERSRIKLMLKELSLLKTKLLIINEAILLLSKYYARPLVDKLNKILQCSFVLDPKNPAEYENRLTGYRKRSKSIELQISLKEADLQKIRESKETKDNQAGYTREYFTQIFVTLSQFNKYEIDETKTTAGRVAESLKRYKNHLNTLTQHYKTQKNGKQ